MKKFNFVRGSRTKRGEVPTVRIVGPDHEIYKMYLKARKIQTKEIGHDQNYVDPKYINQVLKQMKEENENVIENK